MISEILRAKLSVPISVNQTNLHFFFTSLNIFV